MSIKNMAKKWVTLIVTLLITITLFSSQAYAMNLKIQAMRLGSSWYVFGATLTKLLNDVLPAGTKAEVVPKGGGVGNPISVNNDAEKIGLSNVATVVWAYQGNSDVYKDKTYTDVRALVGNLNSVWVTAIARNEYIKKTGSDTLEKVLLSGKPVRIVMKPAGSSVPVVADMILEAMGTSRDKIEANGGKIIQVGAGQIPSLMRDGRADLYFETAIKGHPALTETTLTSDVRFLDLPDGVLKKLSKQGLNPRSFPKWFKGQSGPTMAVDLGTVLIANKNISDEIAYLITKTLCENKEAMVAAHKAWAAFAPEEAWKPENVGIPLHPGAARYYKEKGWMK